jgi:NAD(P)-dependent dehydrogenase (short-subunit alcohol dehydrogenase family)
MTTTPRSGTVAGRTVLVTGATSGIGRALAAELARGGAHVLLHGRDRTSAATVAGELRVAQPGAHVQPYGGDLSDLSEVRALAADVAGEHPELDALVNNAGVSKFTRQLSADGFEMTLAVNHLAPFVLTNLLLPNLTAAGEARVVTVSSDVHKQVKAVDWDDLQADKGEFVARKVYDRSKLFNIWFARALAERVEGTGVTSNSLSPGFVRTRLGREATGFFKVFLAIVGPLQKSPVKGAATPLHVVASPEVSGVNGAYFEKSEVAEPSVLARDDASAARLWSLSEQLTGRSRAT